MCLFVQGLLLWLSVSPFSGRTECSGICEAEGHFSVCMKYTSLSRWCRTIIEDTYPTQIGAGFLFKTSISTFKGPLRLHQQLHSLTQHSFSDGRRFLHNASIHHSVYAVKINFVKSKGSFTRMLSMLFQRLVFLFFLVRWVRSCNGLRLLCSAVFTE